MAATADLVRDYLEHGGTVTHCPPAYAAPVQGAAPVRGLPAPRGKPFGEWGRLGNAKRWGTDVPAKRRNEYRIYVKRANRRGFKGSAARRWALREMGLLA